MRFIIADADSDYTAALANRIHQISPALSIERCHRSDELQQLIADERHRSEHLFFLFNRRDFLELERLVEAKIWPKTWKACAMDSDAAETGVCSKQPVLSFQRFSSARELVRQLSRLADGDIAASSPGIGSGQPIGKADTNFSDAANHPERLWCLVSFDTGHAKKIQTRLKFLIREGRQVIYLPLKPAYLADVITHVSQGPSLSDLLLALSENTVQAVDIGQYWQPQPEGFLCFRPPGRADDLVTCEPELIRRLVQLFLKRSQQTRPAR